MENEMEGWYKNAIIYGLDVSTFFDSDGDGVGDFKGATTKLDYLEKLGVNCIWLLPFYPTSNRDNGYDVIEYKNVDERWGTLEDFRTFVKEAKKRGFYILIDLVVHHSSDQHPWFLAATTDTDSKYFDYYIWTKQIPKDIQEENVFPGAERGVWHYDENAMAYFHHKYYHFEPDLNVANPDVVREIYEIISFWLSFDVDGFRIDSATHLFEEKGVPGTKIEEPRKFINDLRKFIVARKSDAIMLAEADVEVDELETYIGRGDRFQLLYNFLLNNSVFLSLANKNSIAVSDCLKSLGKVSEKSPWANFVRNLDELDLGRLSKKEREKVYEEFAPEPHMRIYNRGIRRRTAPMLGGEIKWMKMLYSLLFSLPGCPVFVYGDEIGMGDDLSLPERVSVRTPMQWRSAENAWFSTASSKELVRGVIQDGKFGYKNVNVERDMEDKDSLLNFFRQVISLRKKFAEIGECDFVLPDTNNECVLAIFFEGDERDIFVLHNFSDKEQEAQVGDFPIDKADEVLSDGGYVDKGEVLLHGFGYRWLVKSKT